MWPFSSRKAEKKPNTQANNDSKFELCEFKINDAYIKLWLSEKMTDSLDVIANHHFVSRPDVLRWIFFEHAYGRELFVELQKFKEEELQKLKDQVDFHTNEVSFKRKVATERKVNQQFVGKATENIKLWLPSRLKNDLINLAEKNQQPLSDYLRARLVIHLYGRTYYEEWLDALAGINKKAHAIENSV